MAALSSEETRLVFIRHGEALAAVDRLVAGHRTCRGLSGRGQRQAEALRDRLIASRELEPDAVLTSVLPRAIETAEILAPALGGLSAQRDCDFCELHPGECDGLTWEQYQGRYGFDMRKEPDRPMSPGGESLGSFQARVERRLERMVRDHAGQTVVIVCHGGVVSAASLSLMSHVMHASPVRLQPENTSITEWLRPASDDPGGDRWMLIRFNDFAHIGSYDFAHQPDEEPGG